MNRNELIEIAKVMLFALGVLLTLAALFVGLGFLLAYISGC